MRTGGCSAGGTRALRVVPGLPIHRRRRSAPAPAIRGVWVILGPRRRAMKEPGTILFLALSAAALLGRGACAAAVSTGPHDAMEGMQGMEATEPSDRWTGSYHGYAFLASNRQGGRSGDR